MGIGILSQANRHYGSLDFLRIWKNSILRVQKVYT